MNPAVEAVEPVGEPADPVREALAWYVDEHQGGGTRLQKRKQAALFQLVSIDGWPPGEAARALGYTPVGQRLAVERVRLALETWWAERAAEAGEDTAEPAAAVA